MSGTLNKNSEWQKECTHGHGFAYPTPDYWIGGRRGRPYWPHNTVSMEPLPLHLPPIYQDRADSGRLILRDGSTATIRLSTPPDSERLREFFARLSPETLRQRFLSISPPALKLIDTLCDSSDPSRAVTLLVIRSRDSEDEIIATGCYISRGNNTAEVAMTVDDSFQGKGAGSQLLERLAVIATRNGFVRFWALTETGNRKMIDVFRHSGFPVTERIDQ